MHVVKNMDLRFFQVETDDVVVIVTEHHREKRLLKIEVHQLFTINYRFIIFLKVHQLFILKQISKIEVLTRSMSLIDS
jgi:hypothetical protein